MEDSAMDMTAVCSSSNTAKPELNGNKEDHEVIFQENHELKKKIQVLEKCNMELESDNNYLTRQQAKETTKFLKMQEELEKANSKIKYLESTLEEERTHVQRLVQEMKDAQVNVPCNNVIVVPDQEQLNILTSQIENLEIQRKDDYCAMRELAEEKEVLVQKLNMLSAEKQALQGELSEIKDLLEQKTIDQRDLNIALESIREEKLLMQSEIQLMKASDTNAARGNSLFAEVEDNRQKIAAQRELLKLKYMNLKKMFNQKQVENNKLKLEIVKIRREEKEDEKSYYHDYSNLIESYKQRVGELEAQVRELESKAATQPSWVAGPDSGNWLWVQSVIEEAKKETRSLQAELDRRGTNYVVQAHQLLDSQKENRKLKSVVAKLKSDIDELKLELDTIKSAKENLEDGISPPATEVALEYQKQKMVRFKNVFTEQVKNTSLNLSKTKLNSSSSDPVTSTSEQNKSLKESDPNEENKRMVF